MTVVGYLATRIEGQFYLAFHATINKNTTNKQYDIHQLK